MTDNDRIALEARLEALTMAVEQLFKGAQDGAKARETFIANLATRARYAEDDHPRQDALLAEVARWKGRQT